MTTSPGSSGAPRPSSSGTTGERSKVLECARGVAALLGGVAGAAIGIKELVWDDTAASFSDVWGEMATSTIGLAAFALLASVAALVNRFASPAPNISDLADFSDEKRNQWKALSAEAQAWREFVGDIIPTAIVGASFGFAVVALAAQFSDRRGCVIVAAVAGGLLMFVAAVVFLSKRREELEGQVDKL